MRRFLHLGLLALTCIPSFAEGGGQVLGIVGIWKNSKGASIHFGATLKDEQDVVCDGSGSLTILLKDAGKTVTLPCESQGKHTNIKTLADQNSQGVISEFARRLIELVTIRIGKDPKTYIAAVSRGFGNPEVEESVLPLSGTQVDMSPALASAPAGHYALSLFPLADDTPDGTPVGVEWKPGMPATIAVPGLQPGPSKLALVSDGAATSIAWVLLAGPNEFAKDAKAFADAKALVSKWQGGTHAPSSRSVLRAYLQALAAGNTP